LGFYLSTTLNEGTNWNYRKTDQRLIVIKTKNDNVRIAAVLDALTNLSFAINVPEDISMENFVLEREYLAHLNVYTLKSFEGIDEEFVNFFDELDVDQALENFIEAYWIYPSKIRFDLTDLEEP
jgi:hypothetical protein